MMRARINRIRPPTPVMNSKTKFNQLSLVMSEWGLGVSVSRLGYFRVLSSILFWQRREGDGDEKPET
jgi:hypothetical protein